MSKKVVIETLQTEDRRFRKITKPDGTVLYLPSSTTILSQVQCLSKYFEDWKGEQAEKLGVLGKRIQLYLDAERGTAVHRAIELWNAGNDLDWRRDHYTQEEWGRINRYMNWVKERSPKFIGSEFPVYHEAEGYSGQLDGIVELELETDEGIKPHTFVIDFKTGQLHETARLQIASYYYAYCWMLEVGIKKGKRPDGCILLSLGAKTKKGYKDEILVGTELQHYIDGFIKHLDLFDWMNQDFEPNVELLPATFIH